MSEGDAAERLSEELERTRQRRERRISVSRESSHVWRVSGSAIERMVVQTDWDNDEAVAYLQHRFARLGIDAALAEAGCAEGDEVRILGFAFTYEGDGKAGGCGQERADTAQLTGVGARARTDPDGGCAPCHDEEHGSDG